MKVKAMACAVLLACAGVPAMASGEGIGFGFGLADSAGNLGINAEIRSPSFARNFLRARVASQADWLSAFRSDPDAAWEPFSSHRIGLVASGGGDGKVLRLYGEFGGLAILPAAPATEDRVQGGIYGLFGFEFFVNPSEGYPLCYYLEAGTNSLFDTAEKLPGKPDYYTGFTTRVGLRRYF